MVLVKKHDSIDKLGWIYFLLDLWYNDRKRIGWGRKYASQSRKFTDLSKYS